MRDLHAFACAPELWRDLNHFAPVRSTSALTVKTPCYFSQHVDPTTGRARLSYRRAAELFDAHTAGLDGGPFTLHQLWHSALTHAAEDGASTPMLMKMSGHTSVRSLAKYARPSTGGAGPMVRPDRSRRPRTSIAGATPPIAECHKSFRVSGTT
ncbi:tyrosine-type recombinase/integrase [Nocardia sp. NPDC004278]